MENTKLMEKILEYLYEHPYSRKRYIAKACGIWQCHIDFLSAINNLKALGLIAYQTINDYGNMEFYDEWYLTDEGKRAIIVSSKGE